MCNLFPLWYADADIYDNKIIENSMQSGKDSSTLIGIMLLNILWNVHYSETLHHVNRTLRRLLGSLRKITFKELEIFKKCYCLFENQIVI